MKLSPVIACILTKTVLVHSLIEQTAVKATVDSHIKNADHVDVLYEENGSIKLEKDDHPSRLLNSDLKGRKQHRSLGVLFDSQIEIDENDESFLLRGCICSERNLCESLETFLTRDENEPEELRMCFWSSSLGFQVASIEALEIAYVDDDGSLLTLQQADGIADCNVDSESNLCTAQVNLQGNEASSIEAGMIMARGKVEFHRLHDGDNSAETTDIVGFTEFDIVIPTEVFTSTTVGSAKNNHSFVYIVTAVTIGGLAALYPALRILNLRISQIRKDAELREFKRKEREMLEGVGEDEVEIKDENEII